MHIASSLKNCVEFAFNDALICPLKTKGVMKSAAILDVDSINEC